MLKRHLQVSNASVTSEPTVLTLAQAHAELGHTDVEKTHRTAKALGWILKDGIMEPCASWASGKAKQRCIHATSERVKATKPDEQWYHVFPQSMIKKEPVVPRSNCIYNMII